MVLRTISSGERPKRKRRVTASNRLHKDNFLLSELNLECAGFRIHISYIKPLAWIVDLFVVNSNAFIQCNFPTRI